MSKKIVAIIEEKLKLDVSKDEIEKELSLKFKNFEYKDILGLYPEAILREKYKLLNSLLIAAIALLSILKIPVILSMNIGLVLTGLGFFILAFFSYGIINELLKSKRTGYIYVIMYSVIGLSTSNIDDLSNQLLISFGVTFFLIATSLYLSKKLFNKYI